MKRRGRRLLITVVAAWSFGAVPTGARLGPQYASAATCPTDGAPVELESTEQVRGLLVGVWVRCYGPAIFDSPFRDVGLEVTKAGEFHRLYRAGDGSLTRASGVEQEGIVSVEDLTDMNGAGSYQASWSVLGADTQMAAFVSFTASPATMSFEPETAIYVRRDSVTPIDGIVPGQETGCGILDDPVELDPDDIASEIVGVWLRCSGPPVLGTEEAEVGIELDADGGVHRIYRDDDGGLISAAGLNQEGEWSVTGAEELGLVLLGGRGRWASLTLFDAPARSMRLAGNAEPIDLRRWDGTSPTPGAAPGLGDCGAIEDPITPTSADQAIQLFVGVWIPCVGEGGPNGQVGLEIAADGRYHRVYQSAAGGLIRADGLKQEGDWSLVTDGPAGRYVSVFGLTPIFFASPVPSLWMDPGVTIFPAGAYQRWTGDPPVFGPPPGPVPPCGFFREQVVPASADQASALLVGAWTLCDPNSVLGSAVPGEVGIEFDTDGGFHLLLRQPDGSIVAGRGPGLEGTWNNVGFTSPGIAQIDLEPSPGRLTSANPLFFDEPDSVYFSPSDTRYVRGAPLHVIPPTGGDVTGVGRAATAVITVGLLAVLIAACDRRRCHRAGTG